MALIRVIPTLLLKNDGLVKTVRFKDPKYVGDPINAVKIFNDKEVDELIFLDITATAERRKPNLALLKEIASECFMPLTYGGGIRTMEEIKDILKVGIEKVCLNAIAIEDPEMVKNAVKRYGSSTICVAMDVGKNLFGKPQVYIRNGSKKTGMDPLDFARKMDESGVGELLINSIDRDGTMNGYDIELIKKITSSVSMPVIACGGAGKFSHLKQAIQEGRASAVAAGSMFVFHGSLRSVLISYLSPDELKEIQAP